MQPLETSQLPQTIDHGIPEIFILLIGLFLAGALIIVVINWFIKYFVKGPQKREQQNDKQILKEPTAVSVEPRLFEPLSGVALEPHLSEEEKQRIDARGGLDKMVTAARQRLADEKTQEIADTKEPAASSATATKAVQPPSPKNRLFQREGSWLVDLWFDDGWVLVLLIWAFCWPVMIPYYLFKWTYKFFYVPMDDARQTKQHREYAEYAKEQEKTAEQEVVQRLKDAAPKIPPEKMRATILIEDNTVNMMVELSERERAVVFQHQLDFIELENVARYTAEEIAQTKYDLKNEVEAVNARTQPYLKAVKEVVADGVVQLQKGERRITTVGDLLVVPYTRAFSSVYEAKQHSDTLKQKHLPKVKQIIEQFMDHKAAETVEF